MTVMPKRVMQSKTVEPPCPKKEWCCEAMTLVLDYAMGHNPSSSRRTFGGIQVAHVFSTTGGYKYSPIVYVMPARGRGKERKPTTNVLLSYCPFCGKKQEVK